MCECACVCVFVCVFVCVRFLELVWEPVPIPVHFRFWLCLFFCKGDSQPCGAGYQCTQGVNTYNCVDINECLSNPCVNGATCVDNVADYTCSCNAGFTGESEVLFSFVLSCVVKQRLSVCASVCSISSVCIH